MKLFNHVHTILEKANPKDFEQLLFQVQMWIEDQDDDAIGWLLKNKMKVPSEFKRGGHLFRGFAFKTPNEILEILNGKTLKFREAASWTRDPMVARRFASGENEKDKKFGIVVSKRIPDSAVVIDFYAFCKSDLLKEMEKQLDFSISDNEEVQDFCNDEKEVLVSSSKDNAVALKDIDELVVNGRGITKDKFLKEYSK